MEITHILHGLLNPDWSWPMPNRPIKYVQVFVGSVIFDGCIVVPFDWEEYEQAVKAEQGDGLGLEWELRDKYWEPAAKAIALKVKQKESCLKT